MRGRPNSRRPSGSPARGFTLIELTIVIAIIGILVAFVLAVGAEGVRVAEVRATQSLIAKLEVGLTDRLEALRNLSVTPTAAHHNFAAIPNPNYNPMNPLSSTNFPLIYDRGGGRAAVIAQV